MKSAIDHLLAEKVRTLRLARGLSLARFAELLGMAENDARAIEMGVRSLLVSELVLISKLLEVEAAEFVHHICISEDVDPKTGAVNVFKVLDGDALEFAEIFKKIESGEQREAVMRFQTSINPCLIAIATACTLFPAPRRSHAFTTCCWIVCSCRDRMTAVSRTVFPRAAQLITSRSLSVRYGTVSISLSTTTSEFSDVRCRRSKDFSIQ